MEENEREIITYTGAEGSVAELFEKKAVEKTSLKDLEAITQVGDYLATLNGEQVRIELECHISLFFAHAKKIRDKIDIVIYLDGSPKRIRSPEKRKELENKKLICIRNLLDKKIVDKNERRWERLREEQRKKREKKFKKEQKKNTEYRIIG